MLYFLSISLISFTLSVIFVSTFELGVSERTFLFYSLVVLNIIALAYFILWPLSKYLSIGKRLSQEQASLLIGKYFQEIDDKLYNVLQLKSIETESESDLITASINQKIAALSPIPFNIAIGFSENKKYIKYTLIPIAVLLLLGIFQPNVLKEGTNQLVAHTIEVEPMAPYTIEIENKNLEGIKSSSYTLKVHLNGEEIPNKLYINVSDKQFLLSKNDKRFTYTLQNLKNDITFSFFDGKYRSKNYTLKVLPKPILTAFQMELLYPTYLKIPKKILKNSGDVSVPEGTAIQWKFNSEETNTMKLFRADSAYTLDLVGEGQFSYKASFYKSETYGLSSANAFINFVDTVYYNINVVRDAYPSIEVDSKQDSTNLNSHFFRGFIKDDHGLTDLRFFAEVIGENRDSAKSIEVPLSFNSQSTQTDFYFLWSTDSLKLMPGEIVRYYFKVWDNDGVNGRKSTKSGGMTLEMPTEKGLKELEKKSDKAIKDALNENIEDIEKIKDDLEALNEKLLAKKEVGFQEKQKIEEILERQKKVERNIERMIEQNKSSNQLQEKFKQNSKEMLEKQKQLEELFEKVMTEEMKEMMKEIEEMMDKLNKKNLQNAIEKLELSNEDLENELDRNLELFKQLELEKSIIDAQKKLEELTEDQKQLAKKTAEKVEDQDILKEEQDNLEKEFDEFKKDLQEIDEKNNELEEPNKFEDTESLEDEIKKDMQKSSEELSNKQNKKASESQEKAKEKMNQLSSKLNQMEMQMQSNANAENIEDLRALLENLIQLSFDQEDVMEDLKTTDQNDPKYLSLAQAQHKLKDDSKIIQDSLFALSKRVMQLESKINREITAVNFNMEKAIEELQERNTAQANSRQQFSMTSVNNLALMLDEALQSMQNQMMMQQGGGKCSKPGGKGSKPSSGSLKKLQQQLNKQMGDLKNAMEKGKNPGGQKGKQEGQGSANGQKGMSKSLAKMAAKQAAIREELKNLENELGKGGGGNKLKELQEMMEKTETDLVNKQITRETIRRQEEILSRLLESEKAEREREKDKQRKSTEFTDEIYRNPNEFFEYNSRKEQEMELLKTMPPSFNSFYKNKVSEYFNQVEQ